MYEYLSARESEITLSFVRSIIRTFRYIISPRRSVNPLFSKAACFLLHGDCHLKIGRGITSAIVVVAERWSQILEIVIWDLVSKETAEEAGREKSGCLKMISCLHVLSAWHFLQTDLRTSSPRFSSNGYSLCSVQVALHFLFVMLVFIYVL